MLLHGAKKLDAAGLVDDFWVVFAGSIIAATGTGDSWQALAPSIPAEERVDARGLWLTPGFIDLHAHGGGGGSFDDDEQSILTGLATHRAHGTTRSVLSLVANPLAALTRSLGTIARLAEADPLVLGSHLEGPFLSTDRCGAHDPSHLLAPEAPAVDELLAASGGTLRQITIAPELPGAMEAIERLVAAGVTVAIGHTDADLELSRQAFDRGATLLTHAFNAMRGIHHRAPGPVVAALADPRVALELILDGVHVHPDVARLCFTAAPQRIALVTDAMAAAGSLDGDYRLGSLNVSVAHGRATLRGTDTIAGSTLTQDVALRMAVEETGIDAVSAVRALTATPARALGEDERLGYVRQGYAADAVLLDDAWSVRAVFADGARIA